MTGDPSVLCEAFELLEDLRDELKTLTGWDHDFIEDLLIRWEDDEMDKISTLQMHHLRRIHREAL